MGIELFGRRAVVTVGTTRIDGLRTTFKIDQTDRPEPTGSEISVFNLSATTRGKVQDQELPLTLEAGYGEDIGQVFAGDIRKDGISSRRDGADWITTFRAMDGGEAFRNARIQEAFASGTKIRPVLEKLARSMGVGLGNSLTKLREGDVIGSLSEFFGGAVLSGRSSKEMERVFRSVGYDYSIQDGELQLTELGAALDKEAILLSSETGLVGSPEPGAKGLTKIRSLLQPTIRPRRKIKIVTDALRGFYVARKIKHNGDTHGPAWYSDIEATQI